MRNIIIHYPLSSCILTAIWVLCFADIPETPLSHVSLIDKWTHVAMYLVWCLVITIERLRAGKEKARPKQLLLWVWLLPTLMGGLIEILQAHCTGGRRSGEWLDFLADTIGTSLALAIGILLARFRAKG
ncbi:VanZ family protein [Prevotella dentasini]|uniref:VanZ family protein n=1 Tax=Prevotella dentasini TaxID=589537 RepID=UPI000AA5DC5A|nr:VanZ family protein [Prevotella dentasini]